LAELTPEQQEVMHKIEADALAIMEAYSFEISNLIMAQMGASLSNAYGFPIRCSMDEKTNTLMVSYTPPIEEHIEITIVKHEFPHE